MKKIYLGLILTAVLIGISIGYYHGNIMLSMYAGIVILIHGLLKMFVRYYRNMAVSDSYKNFKMKFIGNNSLLEYINKEVPIGITLSGLLLIVLSYL